MCDEWLNNKLKNPRTGRAIKVGGPVYKKLEKECEDDVKVNPFVDGGKHGSFGSWSTAS